MTSANETGVVEARSATRLRVLAEASQAFAKVATDVRLLLDEIAHSTAYLVGDGCVVTLIDSDGESLFNAASAHQDPGLEQDYKSYLAGQGISKTSSQSVSAGVARTGKPAVVAEIAPETVTARSDPGLRPLVARLNVHSYVVVPIRARGNVLGTLSLFRSCSGRGYSRDDVTMLEDLADRAGLAIENARLYDQLEQRVRQRTAELEAVNAELEAFSYSVAHDLRTPLRAINGFARAVLEDCADQLNDTGKTYLNRVTGAAEQMNRQIDGLLDLSRIARTELRRQPVDVSALAEAAVARLREAEPERQIDVLIEPRLRAHGDPRLVEVALDNLLGNAWKFTRKSARGQIHLGASVEAHRPPTFFVSDNGAGFDPAQARHLFGAFQRLHDSKHYEGTGIGLATVRRIVHRHGGRIWAEGQPERGATFFFTLAPG